MQNKAEISSALSDLWERVLSTMQGLNNLTCHLKPDPDVWSISEELGHIILSAAPIAKVLNMGPGNLKPTNAPIRTPMSYDDLSDFYWETLKASKVVAPARFAISDDELPNLDDQKYRWSSIGKGIQDGLNFWSEEALDSEQLKHPLLGYLTLREMLFFTHIHTSHHLKSIQNKAVNLVSLN